ncbi:MAG: metal ABC transporter ATP-binding protein, partial [Planctomycetota bacterium]
IAYVPQRESVDWDYPIRARDVVAMGLYGEIGLLRRVRREHLRRADEALERVGMGELGDRRIGALSGGQQQRVFLARALVQGADLYVMDEPFAGVDATTERALLELMRGLRAAGSTLLCVHHDLGTVPEFFDHVVLLNRRTVAAGPVGEAFTQPHLEACYGRNVRAAGPAADER